MARAALSLPPERLSIWRVGLVTAGLSPQCEIPKVRAPDHLAVNLAPGPQVPGPQVPGTCRAAKIPRQWPGHLGKDRLVPRCEKPEAARLSRSVRPSRSPQLVTKIRSNL